MGLRALSAASLVAFVLMNPVTARADATVLVGLKLDYRLFFLGKPEDAEVGAIAPSRKHPQRIAARLHFAF